MLGSTDNFLCEELNDDLLSVIKTTYCADTPQFYPASFSAAASQILMNELGLSQLDICFDNFFYVYIIIFDTNHQGLLLILQKG